MNRTPLFLAGWKFWCQGACAGLFVGGLARAQVPEPPVELPPFVVTSDDPSAPPWRYAEVPGFEILSQASADQTSLVVAALYRGRVLTLPAAFRPTIAVPTAVILFNQRPDRATTAQPLDSRKSGQDQMTHWTNVIKRTQPDREMFCTNLWGRGLSYTSTFRFDLRTLLALHTPAVPFWLQAGLYGPFGIYWEDVRYFEGGDTLSVHHAEWFSNAEIKLASRLWSEMEKDDARLPGKKKLDLSKPSTLSEKLTSVGQLWSEKNASYVSTDAGQRWLATCSLFVRWAIFADQERHAEAFWSFVDEASSRPVSEEMFRAHFGLGYEEMQAVLSWYFPRTLNEISAKPVRRARPPTVALRTATPVEIARLRGEWERGEAAVLAPKFPELAAKYREHAGQMLRTAYQRDASDPRLAATLGLYEFDVGNFPRARELLERATTADVVRPLAYLDLARLRYAEIAAAPAGVRTGRFTEAQMIQVLDPLFKARSQPPAMLAVYELAAQIWDRFDAKPAVENLAVLLEGARLFPRHREFILRSARMYARYGYVAEASALCGQGMLFAQDEAEKAPFEEILKRLPKS